MSGQKRTRNGFTPSPCLCWKCNNAVPGDGRGCSWSREFSPVDGWIAKPSKLHKGGYRVLACPEFDGELEQGIVATEKTVKVNGYTAEDRYLIATERIIR